MKNKKSLKNLKQFRVKSKFQFYVVFRPRAQKLFFPICFLIFSIACTNHWYNNRGVWVFENAAAQVGNQAQDQSHERSEEAPMEDGTSRGTNTVSVADVVGGTQVSSVSGSVIEAKILEAFNGDKVALAVAKGESGLDPNAKGYNCKYGSRSTSCKPEDRHKAWSVDCGIYQINTIAKDCPEHLLDPETNIEIAKKMQEKRGWSPWVAFWNGQYKNHMN